MANASKTKTTQVCELIPMESMTSDTVNSFLSISSLSILARTAHSAPLIGGVLAVQAL